MGKRKRVAGEEDSLPTTRHFKSSPLQSPVHTDSAATHIQIVTGSYEKVLHGITASFPAASSKQDTAANTPSFSDTFLFHAHTSAIRCLALSPQTPSEDTKQPQKVILATGSNDERINIYQLSATVPREKRGRKNSAVPTFAGTRAVGNSKNRELGSLLHHSSSVSALCFPTKSKLLSASEDNTIAVTRTRDWTVLSTIKVPIPKAVGRPSGDTAPLGAIPAGVNDFAVHPSLKVMISVGKGEKCMRLWNLVTGKKAGVLSFERDLLKQIGESKWGGGEGQKVEWDPTGEEFAIVFERGVVVFGMNCKPKCVITPAPRTKLHQIRYIARDVSDRFASHMLSISTEDGRILFYSTASVSVAEGSYSVQDQDIPACKPLAQLGGKTSGLTMRIKDYEVLRVPVPASAGSSIVIVAGSSDGSIRLWNLNGNDLICQSKAELVSAPTDSSIEPPGGKVLDLYGRHNATSSPRALRATLMGEDLDLNSEYKSNGTAKPHTGPLSSILSDSNSVSNSNDSLKQVTEMASEEILKINGECRIDGSLQSSSNEPAKSNSGEASHEPELPTIRQVGRLFGTCETGQRIICLKAFLLHDRPDGMEDDESEGDTAEEFNGIKSSSEEDSDSNQ